MSRLSLSPALRRYAHRAAPIAAASWTPTDLGAVLKSWWDFSDATTLYTDAGTTPVSADGQAIYQANDKSGQANHLRQATAAKRPLYKASVQNGRSVARFNGIPDGMEMASINNHPIPGAQHYHVAIVASVDVAARKGYWIGGTATGNNLMVTLLTTESNGLLHAWYNNDGASAGGVISQSAFYVLMAEWDGTTQRTYVNGTRVLNRAATGKNTAPSTWILGKYLEIGTYLDGDVAEHLICDDDLSTASKNSLGNYLAARYGLTWNTIS